MCCLSLHNFTPISPATTNQILKDSLYNDNSCTVCTIILRVINFTVFKVRRLSYHGILVLEHFLMKAIIRTFTKYNIPLYPPPCDEHVINPNKSVIISVMKQGACRGYCPCAWFLEITLVQPLVCVCGPAPWDLITSSMNMV